MEDMKLYALSRSMGLGAKIAEYLGVRLFSPNTEKFLDGELNIKLDESVRDRTILVVARLEMPYENLFELILFCDAAKRASAKEIIAIIPYLPHSRQERRDNSRSPISARIIADMLQNAGIDRIMTMDLHTNAIEGFYKIPFDKLSPIDIFVDKIKSLNIDNLGLVSPDFGFMKKIEKYQSELGCSLAVINKHRMKANEISKMELIGDVKDKNIIIIDDLIDTAGTLVKASDLVLSSGAKSVTVFATHGVLSQNDNFSAIQRLQDSNIKSVFISNTLNMVNKNLQDKINVIDISSVFCGRLNEMMYG